MSIFEKISGKLLKIVVGTAIAVGATAAVVGTHKTIKAKKMNKQAEGIQNEALRQYGEIDKNVNESLENLGNSELSTVKKFPHFCDLIENIQNRPEIAPSVFSPIKVQKTDIKTIKKMSNTIQVAFAGVGGAGAGALVGLAAFGVSAAVFAPVAAGGGIAICIKGCNLEKKAIENKNQARKLQKKVNDICSFYSEVILVSDSFRKTIISVNKIYDRCLSKMETLVLRNPNWKTYSQTEKENIQNVIMITRLLYEMCSTKIVIKDETTTDAINTEAINDLTTKSYKLIQTMA